MIATKAPCQSCKHFRRDIDTDTICAAFPDGIPIEIIAARHDHREPYPGDHGIRYEPITMNAARFREHFDGKTAALPWIKQLTRRTDKMLRLLGEIGDENGFFVNVKKRKDDQGRYGNKKKMSFDM
jgi:hypothetical protein